MNRFSLLLLILLIMIIGKTGAAENEFFGSISFAETGKFVEGATVRLLDTSKVQKYSTISRKDGKFEFKKVIYGKYILRITFVGTRPIEFLYTLTEKSKQNLGHFDLDNIETKTGEVVVEADAILGEMVGDTAQYNADAFKVDNNAKVDELLQKIPGVEITAGGAVKAHGKQVEIILVDGRKFFGTDPKIVLENVPAKIVNKVQVYDKTTDMNEFIGKNADKDLTAINLVLKKESKVGAFGNAALGGGSRSRYECNSFVSLMHDLRRTGIIGFTSNTNYVGFDVFDLNGMGNMSADILSWSDGGRLSGRERDGAMTQTSGIGFNISNDWGIFKKSNIMYFYKNRREDTRSETKRGYFPETAASQITESDDNGSNDYYFHGFEVSSDEAELSKRSAVRLGIKGNYKHPESGFESEDFSEYRSGGGLVNSAETLERSRSDAKSLGSEITYRYKFDKPGRTFGATYYFNYSEDDGEREFNSLINYYAAGISDTLKQFYDNFTKSNSHEFEITASEPVSKNSEINFDYKLEYSDNRNNAFAYDLEKLKSLDSVLSNQFTNQNSTNNASLGYIYRPGNLYINANAAYEYSRINGSGVLPYIYKVDYSTGKFLPEVVIEYQLGSMMNKISLSYKTRMTLPSAGMLEEVLDNSNPLWLRIGNSALKAEYSRNAEFRLDLMSPDWKKTIWVTASLSQTDNALSSNFFTAAGDTVINNIPLTAGSHLTRYVNLDGQKSCRFEISTKMPLHFYRKIVCGTNLSISYSENPTLINDFIYKTDNTAANARLTLQTNFSRHFSFTIGGNYSYHIGKNNAADVFRKNEYNQYGLNASMNYSFLNCAHVGISLNNTFYSGSYFDSGDYDYSILNVSCGADFLKSKALNVELQALDLLHDLKSVSNITYADYTEFVRRKILQNYVLLKITYKFNTMGKKQDSGTQKYEIGR